MLLTPSKTLLINTQQEKGQIFYYLADNTGRMPHWILKFLNDIKSITGRFYPLVYTVAVSCCALITWKEVDSWCRG